MVESEQKKHALQELKQRKKNIAKEKKEEKIIAVEHQAQEIIARGKSTRKRATETVGKEIKGCNKGTTYEPKFYKRNQGKECDGQ